MRRWSVGFSPAGLQAVRPPAQLSPLDEGGSDEVDEGKRAIAPLRASSAPTAEEVEEHEANGHCNYRSWCRACVAGRGRSDAHVSENSDENALPMVAIDYAYLGDSANDSEDKASPILVLRSGRDRWTYSEVFPAKGVQNTWRAKRLAVELAMVPWTRFTLKSDQEPAILALKTEALKCLKVLAAKEVVLEESPVGDSQSNGLAEMAVREVKGVVRSLRWALEELHGMKISSASAVLPWYAAPPRLAFAQSA